MKSIAVFGALVISVSVLGCAASQGDESLRSSASTRAREAASAVKEAPAFEMGNGVENWIVVDDFEQTGATFSFSQVKIDGNGWLVMHPFANGAPNGAVVAGSTYIEDGESQNVEITVDAMPASGANYIVMLHRDVNENREFDFVFVDERNVLDRAVFEGHKMIGLKISARP